MRQINGHSSEEEKEEEQKEPWPDDHSSSRYGNAKDEPYFKACDIYHCDTPQALSYMHMKDTSLHPDIVVLCAQRLLQRLLGLDGRRGHQLGAAQEKREGEEEEQQL